LPIELKEEKFRYEICSKAGLVDTGVVVHRFINNLVHRVKKMNIVRQHLPSFIDNQEPIVAEFKTTEELLNLDFIKYYADLPDFYKFSIGGNLLMAEYKDGSSWWVIGTIIGTTTLPAWVPQYDALIDTKRLKILKQLG